MKSGLTIQSLPWGNETLDLHVPAGGALGLVGKTGTGKSRIGRILAGIEDEPAAKLILHDRNLNSLKPAERCSTTGYIPTQPALLFSGLARTLREELSLSFSFQGLPPDTDKINRIVIDFEVSPLLDRDLFTLSGGEKIRAAMAVALVKTPDLLILDDIQRELEPLLASRLATVFKAYRKSEGLIIIELQSCAKCVFTEAEDSWAFLTDSGIVNGGMEACWEKRGTFGHYLFPYSYRIEEQLRSSMIFQPSPTLTAAITPEIKVRSTHETPDENIAVVTDMIYRYQGTDAFTLGPINLSIQKGKTIAILGPNGSGKTTLLKCLANLLPDRKGQIAWGGINLQSSDPIWAWAKHSLYCFQDPDDQLFMESITDELACTARHAAKRNPPDSVVKAMAASLGIEPYSDLSPFDAPIPVRRLALIGAALLANPKLLLLDEPTLSLDAKQVELLTSELKQYTDAGGTILTVSHDYDFVAEIADKVLLMKDGEIVNQVERDMAEFPCAETLQPSIIRRALRAGIHPPPWGLKELKGNLQARSMRH